MPQNHAKFFSTATDQCVSPNSLRFDHTPEEMSTLTDEIIIIGNAAIDKIAAIPDAERTFENSILPVAAFESEF